MKKHSILLAIIFLVLASLACQTLSGGGAPQIPSNNNGGNANPQVTIPPLVSTSVAPAIGDQSEFPMPNGAFNVVNMGGTLNFQVKMSLNEAMKFYKDAFTGSGYKERSILTVTSDTTFSMVFDGHKSGKAIVVQGVDLKDGSVNINIRLEKV